MKPKSALRSFLLLASSTLLAISYTHAASLTWDANGATIDQTDGAGVWLTAGQWWDGATNQTWASTSDAIFGNSGTGGAVTLASPTTVNTLTLNSFSGTYTLGTAGQTITLTAGLAMNSGAGAATIVSPVTLGGAQSWLNNSSSLLTVGTGAMTNGGYLLTVGGSGNTTISSVIGGVGGVTKQGAGVLTLSGTNTFTGQLTVGNGTLSIATIANVATAGTLGASITSVPVILGSSGGNTGKLQYTGITATSTKTFTLASGGTGAFDVTVGANTLTLSGLINGSGGLTKLGAGTLVLSNNANQITGPVSITGGKLKFGAQYTLSRSVYDTTGSTGALDVTSYATPVLGGLAGSVDLATAITAYGSVTALTLNPQTGSSVTYGGVIANGTGNISLIKTGTGTQTLTGVNTYSGATNIYAGTLALSGASGSALNSAFTVRGGTLVLDNSGGTWANRISDSAALSLGSLTLKSDNGGVAQTETVGATTFATAGKVTIDNGTGAGTTLSVTGTVARNAGAAIDFVGTGGTLGSGANSPNFTSIGAFPGTSNGILPWATVGGTQWAEDNANSICVYSGSFVALADATSADNAQESADSTLGGAATANSLNLAGSGTQTLALGANNLTLGSAAASPGAILKSGSDPWIISGTGQVRAGSGGTGTELITHVNGSALTISAPLNTAIINIAKGGTGDLILSGIRAATMSGTISIAGGQLEIQGAQTTISGPISGPGGVTVNLNSGQRLVFTGANKNYSGPTVVKGGLLQMGTAYNNQSFSSVSTNAGSIYSNQGQDILSNIELNGGGIAFSYYTNWFLGSGPGQLQITGGRSGISSGIQGDMNSQTWVINNDNNYEVVWGSAYFNPSVFVLQDSSFTANGVNVAGINNKIDLNGATRTIASDSNPNATPYTAGYHNGGRLGGIIRNSSGTAGLIKTGIGHFELAGANTFNGPVSIEQGTLWATSIANGGLASALGTSAAAAANLLLANGTTLKYTGAASSTDRSFTINGTADGHGTSLDASGSAAVNFTNTATPAYGTVDQTRTLTLTGTNTGNNILAANIANNGTGAVSVTKTGAGLWVLSNASNSYTGPTTLTAGTLNVGVAGNLGASSSNLVFNGGTLQITGTGLTSLGRTVICNSGKTVGFDIVDVNNIFTVNQVLNQGTGGLTKLGAGTLVLNQANTYTGTTTISAGTLRLDDGGVIPGAIINNATFLVNKTGVLTIGTDLSTNISGSGTIAAGAGSTITISTPTALQNIALNTTGAGSFILSGVTAPIFSGLSGATGNLATVISSGYAGVTNLTLNTPSGVTDTYGGVIANNAANLSLTKTGAGTQVLQGANTYSGATNINAGTLELSGSGSILNSAITFGGGELKLTNTAAETGSGRVHDTIGITSNGGTLTYNNTSGANVYAETIGSVALTSGQLNIVQAVNQAGTGSQTLTLAGLTPSGTVTVTFSANTTAPNATRNMIKVSGASGAGAGQNLPGGVINGPWATTGTAANAQTDYAVYDASGYVLPANITASAETTWTTAANAYTLSTPAKTATALGATRNITALKASSTATAATAASGTFTVGSAHSLAVGDPVVVSGFGGDITGLAVGTVYYVASVAGSTTFTLAATPGGTALNVGGTVNFTGGLKLDTGKDLGTSGILNSGAAPFGIGRTAAGGSVTLPTAGAGNLYVTAGSAPTGAANSGLNGWIIIDAPIVDNGGALTLVKSGAGVLRLSGASTYTGGTVINAGTVAFTSSSNFGAASSPITFNGSGALSFGPNNSWAFASGGSPDLGTHPIILNNGAVAGLYYNSPNTTMTMSGAITGNSGIIVGQDPTLTFNGGSGGNSFSSLSNGNMFTGPLTLTGPSNGSMNYTFNSLADSTSPITFNSGGSGNFDFGSTATANLSVPNRPIDLRNSNLTIRNQNATYTMTLGAVSTTTSGAKTLTLNNGGAGGTIAGAITNGAGTLSVTKSGAGTWRLSGTNSYTGNTTVSGGTLGFANGALGSSGTINASGGTLQWLSGNTQDISSRLAMTAATTTTLDTNDNNVTFATGFGGSTTGALTKAGAGTLTLQSTNTYTGATTVSTGTLLVNGSLASGSAVTVNGGILGGTGTIGGSVTVNAAGSVAPGASAGTLAITGALNLTNQVNGGSGKLKFELGSIAASDKITVGGNLTIGTAFLAFNDFEFSTLPGLQDGTYTLLTYSGTLSGSIAGSGLTGAIGAGTGTLNLDTVNKRLELVVTGTGAGSPYDTWAGGPGLPFDGDANGDGVKNGLAFLLGATGPNAAVTQPTVSESGGNLILNFNCLPLAARGTASLKVAHSTNLGSWTATTDVVPDANDPTPDNNVTFVVGAGPAGPPELNTVTATIGSAAAAGGGKLFGRLEATQP